MIYMGLKDKGGNDRNEASRMKWISCKTEGVAYQDEKRRMQQIGA